MAQYMPGPPETSAAYVDPAELRPDVPAFDPTDRLPIVRPTTEFETYVLPGVMELGDFSADEDEKRQIADYQERWPFSGLMGRYEPSLRQAVRSNGVGDATIWRITVSPTWSEDVVHSVSIDENQRVSVGTARYGTSACVAGTLWCLDGMQVQIAESDVSDSEANALLEILQAERTRLAGAKDCTNFPVGGTLYTVEVASTNSYVSVKCFRSDSKYFDQLVAAVDGVAN
ncbi:hypothetical protein WNY37_16290 [Henriciella sp. AS95]|uniref:hypothetical protein n=1 Tax=Henriciella sp. AS95 TaxID=3135782 RepID=UPI00316B1C0F